MNALYSVKSEETTKLKDSDVVWDTEGVLRK